MQLIHIFSSMDAAPPRIIISRQEIRREAKLTVMRVGKFTDIFLQKKSFVLTRTVQELEPNCEFRTNVCGKSSFKCAFFSIIFLSGEKERLKMYGGLGAAGPEETRALLLLHHFHFKSTANAQKFIKRIIFRKNIHFSCFMQFYIVAIHGMHHFNPSTQPHHLGNLQCL